MNSFYSEKELQEIGFKSIGRNVKLSRKASIYSPGSISIGDNVRIDDFCILSGNITLGSNIHISAYVALYGAMGIEFEDYTGISPRSTIFSAMDDFGGEYLIGPIHPVQFTNITGGKVIVKRFCQIGCNSVIFPKLTLGEGSIVGACSLITHSTEDWSINYGVPARKHSLRKRGLLKFVLSEE